jgi:NADH oxidase (H2O2-forming)
MERDGYSDQDQQRVLILQKGNGKRPIMAKKVVIIGGGAAGIDVLELLLRGQKEGGKLEITILKREKEGFFSICGLPYALQGMYEIEALDLFKPDLYGSRGVDFRTETEVTAINLEERHVLTDSKEEIAYDDLVIATGSKPFIPPIKGADLAGVHTLSSREDGRRIREALGDEKNRDFFVVGAGWIGLQAAYAFFERGKNATVVEVMPQLLPALLDADMASIVQKWLEGNISLILGKKADAIKGGSRVESVVVDGVEHPADIVLLAAGMRPNVELAAKAALDVGRSGGLATDQRLRARRNGQTLENVYALGDCIEVTDAVTGSPRLSQLASMALIQARVVANNILGLSYSLEPCLSPAVASIAGLQIGSVGATAATAARHGIGIKAGKALKYTRARFFPKRRAIVAKLIFRAVDGRLIGAQIISEETVAERINELTLAIRAGVTATDIIMRERCFDPALSMAEDVIVDAATNAMND